ncbi:hypothetical protein ACJRO7_020060 [Eucalyptus globulus]|uniref:Uncharacterized protein n=1 Tax=Eucalyptus globulus TaxID=34317 RepID=A0ABD3KF99_EUCGL
MAEQMREKPASAEQPPWEDLPPLCWEVVLRHLVSTADLESDSFVCKQFLYISNTVRTCLSITNQLTLCLGSLLWRFPLPIDRLDLSNQKSLRFDGLREMGSKIGALRVLGMNRPHLVSLAPLKRLALSCTLGFSFYGIRNIVLKQRGIEDLDLVAVRFLTDLLTFVDVSHCSNLGMTTSYNFMRQCPFPKAIKMSLGVPTNVNLTDESPKKIGRMCPNLRYLDVGDRLKITGDGISGVLKSCPEISYLKIRGLKNIRNLCIDSELPQLEVLQAEDLKLSDEQLAAFISRYCHQVVKNCSTLREINLRNCHNVRDDVPFLDWMVYVRPSLRRIFPPCGLFFPKFKTSSCRLGCLASDDKGQSMR